MSEGIDFTDKLCRAVFMVGVPFLPVFDKKVEAKKKYRKIYVLNTLFYLYLDWKCREYSKDMEIFEYLEPMKSQEWYML